MVNTQKSINLLLTLRTIVCQLSCLPSGVVHKVRCNKCLLRALETAQAKLGAQHVYLRAQSAQVVT